MENAVEEKTMENAKEILAVDVETDKSYRPFCISMTDTEMITSFYRWDYGKPHDIVKHIMEDHHITKVFHYAQADVGWLRKLGINTYGTIHDTCILAKIALPFEYKYGLKELAEKYLNEKCESAYKVNEWLKRNKDSNYMQIPRQLLKEYNKDDTRLTMKLFYFLNDATKEKVYELERSLIIPVVNMESNGIRIDLPFTRIKLDSHELRVSQISKWFKKIRRLDNLASPKQVSYLLYKQLKLDPPFWKGHHHYSTDALALICLQRQYPKVRDIPMIMEHREKFTKIKMFLRPFIEKNVDGYIYPRFNPMGAVDRRRIKTGRFSSSNPNFLNIPRGNELRELIIPRKGHYFLDLDYSQIEMMLFAFFAKDVSMIKSYNRNEDIHTIHKKIFVDPYRKDNGTNRQIAKNIGFEIIYGIGAPGMWMFLTRMGIHLDEGTIREMLMGWHNLHPRLLDYKKKLYGELRRNGFIQDIYGRRYYLPLAKSYMAVNYVIQGMSANIIKDVMPEINEYSLMLGGRMLLSIYDELLLELPLPAKRKDAEQIALMMEKPGVKLNIPVRAEYQILKRNWGEKV